MAQFLNVGYVGRMIHVYAMCGVAFSGKSTIAHQIADELAIELISLDAINQENGLNGGDGMSIAQWEMTSMIAMHRLKTHLENGQSVVVDDTFSRRILRERCKAVARANGAGLTIVFVDTPINEIRSRRLANYATPTRAHVRDEVFEQHLKTFQFPGAGEAFVRLSSDLELRRWLKSRI